MYEFHPILLEDHARIDRIRRSSGTTMSTFTFPILYLWQETLGYQIHLEDDFLLVRISRGADETYMFPIGNPEKQRWFLEWCIKKSDHEQPVQLNFISPQALPLLTSYGIKEAVDEDRDHFDYLGSLKAYLSMEGKKYQHIRKATRKFLKEHELKMEKINSGNIENVSRLAATWEELNTHTGHNRITDTQALCRAAEAYERLNLDGCLFWEDGQCVGLIITSELSKNTLDIHFSKSIRRDQGLDYYSKQMYFSCVASTYVYFNMEEDLGIEGIRNHKMLLNPIELQPSYKVNLVRYHENEGTILCTESL